MDVAVNTPVSEKTTRLIRNEIVDQVARITLDNPPHNVLTIGMMQQMAEVIEGLNGHPEVKAILLTSSQPTFSAGISLEDSKPERVFQTLEAFSNVYRAVFEISKPFIIVVNGPAIGAGCELVAFGDMVIATPRAKFLQPELKLGVFPPFAAVMLPQLIGPKKTFELILTGDALSAEDALRLGFVNRIFPEAELEHGVASVLRRISEFSGPVLEISKRVIHESMNLPTRDALKHSHDIYLNELMNLQDSQEGLRAVIEKRKPVWKNR